MAAANPVCVDPVAVDFGSIYERHRDYVRRVASRFVRDMSEAEDIAQESFARAFAALHNYRGDASVSTWLTRITINTAIETLRAGKRKVFEKSVSTPTEQEDDAASYEFIESRPDPERRLSSKEQMSQVLAALENLSKYQRQVFEMRFFEEKSLQEIAEVTGRSLSSTKTAIFRARAHVLDSISHSKLSVQ
ncbi:MAG TPA: sigma-70 family RNA polymerase sigma factor [Terriglobales bacterium]|jgi:RNA polymerase sigma-70 factor (ECF subfamily)